MTAWYEYRFDDPAGESEPFGGGPKPDANIACPSGTPVTAILPGVISGINSPDGSIPAWGATITVKMDTPINAIATHYAFLHLRPIPANLHIGQRVKAGDLLGYSGPQGTQGSQQVLLGFALYNGDCYGYGPTYSQYLGSPSLNPTALLTAAQKGTLKIPSTYSTGGVSSLPGVAGLIANNVTLAPDADVTGLLWALDQVLTLENPFTENMQNIQQDSIAGVTFTDPIAWANQFGTNVIGDLSAMVIRSLFLILGLFVLYKVASAFIDFGAIAQSAASGVQTAAKAGVMFA